MKLTKLTKQSSFIIGLIFLISACTSRNTSVVELPPTIRPIYTPVVATTPKFENVTFDEHYLLDCKRQYPPIFAQQVGFHEVYPGVTTPIEALEKLGPYQQVYNTDNGKLYTYATFNFFAIDNLVNYIVVQPGSATVQTVKDVLMAYGCPDLILASIRIDDPSGDETFFNNTEFIYAEEGISVDFDSYPLKLSSPVPGLIFMKPIAPVAYLDSVAESLASRTTVLVSFEETIIGE